MCCELVSFRRSSNFELLTLDSNAGNAFNFRNQCITDASNKSCIWSLPHIEKDRKLIMLHGRIIRLIRKNVLRDTQNSICWQILPLSRWQKKWTIETNKTSLFSYCIPWIMKLISPYMMTRNVHTSRLGHH